MVDFALQTMNWFSFVSFSWKEIKQNGLLGSLSTSQWVAVVMWLNCQKRKQNITKKSPIFGPNSWLGTFDATKTDEISEKIQTAFDPPPHFRKIMLQFFSENVRKKTLYRGLKYAT